MSDLRILINSRKFIRKGITEHFNKRDTFQSLSLTDKEKLKLKFEKWGSDLTVLNERILALLYETWEQSEEESKCNAELKLCQEYDEKLYDCVVSIKSSSPIASSDIASTARSLLKSPVAPLPKYSSRDDEDLIRFFEEFEDTINKFDYAEYDKLLLLKQQVTGRALTLINSLESSNRGYTQAKTLLVKALASDNTQKFNVLRQLTKLRLCKGSDPFEFLSHFKLIQERISKLVVTVDDFLQFFMWEGLSQEFQNQLVQITNNSKPPLALMLDKFFEASDRYLNCQKLSNENVKLIRNTASSKDSVIGMAVDVKYKGPSFKPCSICSNLEGKDANHPIYKCDKNPSVSSKLEQIKKLKGCIRCSNLNHEIGACRYRFNNRCKHCSQWHFSFLCSKLLDASVKETKTSREIKSPLDNKSKVTECRLNIVIDASKCFANIGSILPTFTCMFEDRKVRCLKDSGCQCNLISTSLADELGLRVIEESVCLTVNGINSSQQYQTRIVEANVQIGKETRLVQAICKPDISIGLNLPLLGEVVKGFRERGYNLGDEFLNNSNTDIKDINFILGSGSSYCLPLTEHTFGLQGMSLYSESSAGVLLNGNVEQILRDLPYLPYKGPCYEGCNEVSDITLLHKVGVSDINCFVSELSLDDSLNPLAFKVLDEKGEVIDSMLEKAASQILEENCSRYINLENQYESGESELNVRLVKYALENMKRNEDGRLVVPLLWNSKVSHLLGTNQNLAKVILHANLKKLSKSPSNLLLMDSVFKEQEKSGIIERIDNLEEFIAEHPNHSFMPHIGIFKLDRLSTKCRVVYLSNLCQKDPTKALTVSHNQAIHPGPTLNQKIVSSLLHLRFGRYLLGFDICKAFNNLALDEVDSNRLLCLWFKNVEKGNFDIVGFRNLRLSFGLRCSPTLLLLALYRILILDCDHENARLCEMKKLIYQLCYMDNLAVSFDNKNDLEWAYKQLRGIFEPYRFFLQQFICNDLSLQKNIDIELEVETEVTVKLLGLYWNRQKDCLLTRPIHLDEKAQTKRSILSSIASQYDLYNFNGPMLNRSRLFLHKLQCDQSLGWDEILGRDLQRQWQNIVKQANAAPPIEIPRFVGSRQDSYRLIAFSDSSKQMFGIVVFLQSLSTGNVSFLLAKNRIVGQNLNTKSIPSLELQAICLSVECLVDLQNELAGPDCLKPVDIAELQVFSDSLVALSWIQSNSIRFEKLQKLSVFVKNRLNNISNLCEKHPIKFSFVSGEENPSDCITRCMSYKQLQKSNYFSGPDFLRKKFNSEVSNPDILAFVVPSPDIENTSLGEVQAFEVAVSQEDAMIEHSTLVGRISSFHKIVTVYKRVLYFINKLKTRVKARLSSVINFNVLPFNHNFFAEAGTLALRRDQELYFPEVFDYFSSSKRLLKAMPSIVGQLNVYLDSSGLLRVRSKLSKLKDQRRYRFPILLHKDSPLTKLIILDYHERFAHSGCYTLLTEIRKKFWIPKYFSVVKKILKTCVVCRRLNERSIKLNQNAYRDFRLNPPEIPYRYVFIDYIGPYFVKSNNIKKKVWLLCITCNWSRAVNLKVTYDLSVVEFLRNLQLHCFEFGVPELCISDMGSQLVAGGNIVVDFLKDPEVRIYFEENGMKSVRFEHFFKGNSALGSMVESCVKLTKKLIYSAIRNSVLSLRDFEFLICKTVHLINKRPIAFKEVLREATLDENFPEPITPEILLRGYELVSVNIIPDLQIVPDMEDPNYSVNPSDRVRNNYLTLHNVHSRLIDSYHSEFLATLIHQAVNVKDRYRPVKHAALQKNDIVLIKEPYLKPSQFPMGIIREIVKNDLGEVTNAVVLRGKTREITKRHVSNLIFLLRPTVDSSTEESSPDIGTDSSKSVPAKVHRKAAVASRNITNLMLQDN